MKDAPSLSRRRLMGLIGAALATTVVVPAADRLGLLGEPAPQPARRTVPRWIGHC